MDAKLRNWQPMEDQVFIERLESIERPGKNKIVLTDMATADNEMLLRKGRVLAVGPGKWVPGTWWKENNVSGRAIMYDDNLEVNEHGAWRWHPGYRETPTIKPGQLVIFNARWNDLKDRDLENRLHYNLDENIHLVQENDIAGVLG